MSDVFETIKDGLLNTRDPSNETNEHHDDGTLIRSGYIVAVDVTGKFHFEPVGSERRFTDMIALHRYAEHQLREQEEDAFKLRSRQLLETTAQMTTLLLEVTLKLQTSLAELITCLKSASTDSNQ